MYEINRYTIVLKKLKLKLEKGHMETLDASDEGNKRKQEMNSTRRRKDIVNTYYPCSNHHLILKDVHFYHIYLHFTDTLHKA